MAQNTIVRYGRPFGVAPLSDAIDQLMRDAFTWPRGLVRPESSFASGSNLFETPESYIMQVVLPGAKVEDLRITAQQNVLTLQGSTGVGTPEGATSLWVGIYGGEFRERLTLPGLIDADQATAQYQDGILTLTLPKAEHSRVKAIKIGTTQAAIEAKAE